MRTALRALLWGVGCYVPGAVVGGWMVSVLSTNTHDRAVEAAMTGAFVLGPLAAMVGIVAAVSRARGRTDRPSGPPTP